MGSTKYKLGWPFMSSTPLYILDEAEGKVYSAKDPHDTIALDKNLRNCTYVSVRHVLGFFPQSLRGEAAEVIMDLEKTFHLKGLYKDESSKKYMHIQSFLAFILVHPFCEAFEKLRDKIMDMLEGETEATPRKVPGNNVLVQTDPVRIIHKNSTEKDHLEPNKEERTQVSVSEDDTDKSSVIDIKTGKTCDVPSSSLIPCGVNVTQPLICKPGAKFPVVYNPGKEDEKSLVRLVGVDPDSQKVVFLDKYTLEDTYNLDPWKDGIPKVYVPLGDDKFKIVQPQTLTLNVPSHRQKSVSIQIKQKSHQGPMIYPKINDTKLAPVIPSPVVIPPPPPLKNAKGEIVSLQGSKTSSDPGKKDDTAESKEGTTCKSPDAQTEVSAPSSGSDSNAHQPAVSSQEASANSQQPVVKSRVTAGSNQQPVVSNVNSHVSGLESVVRSLQPAVSNNSPVPVTNCTASVMTSQPLLGGQPLNSIPVLSAQTTGVIGQITGLPSGGVELGEIVKPPGSGPPGLSQQKTMFFDLRNSGLSQASNMNTMGSFIPPAPAQPVFTPQSRFISQPPGSYLQPLPLVGNQLLPAANIYQNPVPIMYQTSSMPAFQNIQPVNVPMDQQSLNMVGKSQIIPVNIPANLRFSQTPPQVAPKRSLSEMDSSTPNEPAKKRNRKSKPSKLRHAPSTEDRVSSPSVDSNSDLLADNGDKEKSDESANQGEEEMSEEKEEGDTSMLTPTKRSGVKRCKVPMIKSHAQKGMKLASLVKKIKKINAKRTQQGLKDKPIRIPKKRGRPMKKHVLSPPADVHKQFLMEPTYGAFPLDETSPCGSQYLMFPPADTRVLPPAKPKVVKPINKPKKKKTEVSPATKIKKSLVVKPMSVKPDKPSSHKYVLMGKVVQCCLHPGCSQHFDTKTHSDYHMTLHRQGTAHIKCAECDIEFSSCRWFCFLKHMKEKHEKTFFDGEGEFGCYLCGLQLEDKETLNQHSMYHYCNRYKCSYCGCKIFSWAAMKVHLEDCDMKKEGKQCNYGCPYCHIVFREFHFYNAHTKSHRDNKFFCLFCQDSDKKEFDSWTQMRQHYVSKHNSIAPLNERKESLSSQEAYSCTKCGRQYRKYSKLMDHMDLIHGKPKHECSQCGSSFQTKQALAWHEDYVHKKQLKCPDCDYEAKTKALLKMHHIQAHREKRHLCHECGKTFRYYHQLKVHMAHHLRQKKHTCKVCQRSFTRYLELRQHLLRDHPRTSNKPLQSCPKCEFKCYSKTTLKLHIKKNHAEIAQADGDFVEHSYFTKKDDNSQTHKAKKKESPKVQDQQSAALLRAERMKRFHERGPKAGEVMRTKMAKLREIRKEKAVLREASCARTRSIDEQKWKKKSKKKRKRPSTSPKAESKEIPEIVKNVEEVQPSTSKSEPNQRSKRVRKKTQKVTENETKTTSGKVTLGDYERPKWVSRSRTRSRSQSADTSGQRRSARVQARIDSEEHSDHDWVPSSDILPVPKVKKSQRKITPVTVYDESPEKSPIPKPAKRIPKGPSKAKVSETRKKSVNVSELEQIMSLPVMSSQEVVPPELTLVLLDHNYCKVPETVKPPVSSDLSMFIVDAPEVSEFQECHTSPETKAKAASQAVNTSPAGRNTVALANTLRHMLKQPSSNLQGFTRVSPGSSDKFTTIRIKSGQVQTLDVNSEVDNLLSFVQSEVPSIDSIDALEQELERSLSKAGDGALSAEKVGDAVLSEALAAVGCTDLDDIELNEADYKLWDGEALDEILGGKQAPGVVDTLQSPSNDCRPFSALNSAAGVSTEIDKDNSQLYLDAVSDNKDSAADTGSNRDTSRDGVNAMQSVIEDSDSHSETLSIETEGSDTQTAGSTKLVDAVCKMDVNTADTLPQTSNASIATQDTTKPMTNAQTDVVVCSTPPLEEPAMTRVAREEDFINADSPCTDPYSDVTDQELMNPVVTEETTDTLLSKVGDEASVQYEESTQDIAVNLEVSEGDVPLAPPVDSVINSDTRCMENTGSASGESDGANIEQVAPDACSPSENDDPQSDVDLDVQSGDKYVVPDMSSAHASVYADHMYF